MEKGRKGSSSFNDQNQADLKPGISYLFSAYRKERDRKSERQNSILYFILHMLPVICAGSKNPGNSVWWQGTYHLSHLLLPLQGVLDQEFSLEDVLIFRHDGQKTIQFSQQIAHEYCSHSKMEWFLLTTFCHCAS